MLSLVSGFLRAPAMPLALVTALALSASASAQTTTGAISGTVVDPQGQIVPGATVTVMHEGTSEVRVTTSDSERGTFQVTSLALGTYTVRVELQGFSTFERKGVVVSSSERVSVGAIRMSVGGLQDTVTVQATGAHVNTEETQHGGVITRTQIEQVQVLGRDVTSLMRLLPGVRYTTPVDSMGGSFGVDVPNVGGLPADWSKVIIDGVVANEVGNSGMQAQMVNLDAIAEVRLLNNSYRAEYGQSGGSQLQIVTRGGTSEYRGSGYWYIRNENLNSTEFFRARSQRLNGVEPFPPKYRFNTYGANLGGPLLGRQNKKLFFFYSLEAPHREAAAERAELADAVGARARGQLLADVRRAGPPDQHPRSAQGRSGLQRRQRRSRLLRGQHHPGVDDQPGPHAGDAEADAAAGVRPADDAGQLQLRHRRTHRCARS